MGGVKATDHSYRPKKLITMNKEEDEHFFNLIQKLDEYNSKDVQKVKFSKEKEERKDVLSQ